MTGAYIPPHLFLPHAFMLQATIEKSGERERERGRDSKKATRDETLRPVLKSNVLRAPAFHLW